MASDTWDKSVSLCSTRKIYKSHGRHGHRANHITLRRGHTHPSKSHTGDSLGNLQESHCHSKKLSLGDLDFLLLYTDFQNVLALCEKILRQDQRCYCHCLLCHSRTKLLHHQPQNHRGYHMLNEMSLTVQYSGSGDYDTEDKYYWQPVQEKSSFLNCLLFHTMSQDGEWEWSMCVC